MKFTLLSRIAVCSLMVSSGFSADGDKGKDQDGWVELFNGKDLSNWVNVNCAPETWSVEDGVIKCTGKPTGGLRMPRQLENFIFEVDWRHMKSGGNAGIFVWGSPVAAPGVPFLRAIEVQVLDHGYNAKGKNEWYTTHGDVFPIHGSSMKPINKGNGQRCFPSEERSKPSPEWNHYRIEANNGKLRLSVNGKEVSGGDDCTWRKGYLGLESEGSPTEWKNLRLKELPSTGATEEDSAPLDPGWKSLFTGVDLRDWTASKDKETAWKGGSWSMRRPDKPAADDNISRPLPFNSFELILDWRIAQEAEPSSPKLSVKDNAGGVHEVDLSATLPEKTNRTGWQRLTLQSSSINGLKAAAPWSLELQSATAPIELANFYIREVK